MPENAALGWCSLRGSAFVTGQLDKIEKLIRNGEWVISISGLSSSAAKAYVFAKLATRIKRRFAVVVDSNADLDAWAANLDFFLSAADGDRGKFVTLPSFETDPYSGVSPHAETQERRALALWQIARGEANIVLLSARSLVQRIPSKDEILALGSRVVRDKDLPPEELSVRLLAAGYIREEPIYGPGQFSVRGGIMDVWPPNYEDPVRIEFFGDTVDSIRSFDADTQLSIEQLREADIAPMREFAASPQDLRDWAFFAAEAFPEDKFARNLRDRTAFAAEGETFSGWEFLLPLSKPLTGTVFDHLAGFTIIADEPAFLENVFASHYETTQLHYSQITESGDVGLEPSQLFLTQDELRKAIEKMPRIELRMLGRTASATDEEFQLPSSPLYEGGVAVPSSFDGTDGVLLTPSDRSNVEYPQPKNHPTAKAAPLLRKEGSPLFLFPTAEKAVEVDILSRPMRRFRGDIPAFAAEFDPRGTIVVSTPGMAERLAEILREYDIYLPLDAIKVGGLSSGFELPSENFLVYSESDIFGETSEYQKPNAQNRRPKSRLGAFISDFRDLRPGDYVVHVDHGIGRFDGLQTISTQGTDREFMLLTYADKAKLFVPVERMDLVSRYSSGESTQPSLDRLGGIGWQKTKARAKRAMRDMADELLKLYAERKLVRGHAFPPDAPWQQEFEDAFPYELTADQAAAIEDVKKDMETAIPMDRLIIGDVGYGKTEVAMRAAFKAVMDGKQVVVLTPTTVLAYQHYETFKKRFSAFPITIELLSRFRSKKEQKEVAKAAENGTVDVLVGTHRLLSNDVTLPKLGLVVVDEEQRFGVGHKERLKHLKKKVDVLTLSATPIPRTLNMSLLGMRDMSVIETPPRDRLAINTQVMQFSEGVIRSAIELEMSRSGQAFLIHNRVESIEAIAALIKKIVPEARIVIGHGQMNEKEMEQVMLDFIDYKYDVLVATTIIENGIDIPRANTIIINRADNYGLSQLYQLRGRVGRSNRRAYAYLLIPSELELTPIARRRLSAIREFSDLGAGFRLAALDLELRGAGNILGGQQSGHLDALGFDLYTKMLERTIAELRGDEIADEVSVSLNLGVDVSIPMDYIADAAQRLRTYKRVASAEDDAALSAIRDEVADRYGRIPHPVERLFDYSRLRKLAEKIGVLSIDRTSDGIAIKLSENARVSPDRLMLLLDEANGAAFSPGGILRLQVVTGDPIRTASDALQAIRADHSVQS